MPFQEVVQASTQLESMLIDPRASHLLARTLKKGHPWHSPPSQGAVLQKVTMHRPVQTMLVICHHHSVQLLPRRMQGEESLSDQGRLCLLQGKTIQLQVRQTKQQAPCRQFCCNRSRQGYPCACSGSGRISAWQCDAWTLARETSLLGVFI